MAEERPRDFGKDIVGLILFGLGTVPAVMLVLWMKADDPAAMSGFGPDLATSLAGFIGTWPALVGSIGLALLGGALFVATGDFSPTKHAVGVVVLAFGLSLVLAGASSGEAPGMGGAVGGGFRAALPDSWGGMVTVALGVLLLGANAWVVWFPRFEGFSEKHGELSPIAAAVRQQEWDGVSPAEAAALIPSTPRGTEPRPSAAGTGRDANTQTAPAAVEKRVRSAAAGASPLVQSDDGSPAKSAPAGSTVQRSGTALEERGAEPVGADLAAAGARPLEQAPGGSEDAEREAARPEELTAQAAAAAPVKPAGAQPLGTEALRTAEPMERPVWELEGVEAAAESEEAPTEVAAEFDEEQAEEVAEEPTEDAELAVDVELHLPEAVAPAAETEQAVELPEPEVAPEPEPEPEPVAAKKAKPKKVKAAAPDWEQADLFADGEDDVEGLFDAIEEEDGGGADVGLVDESQLDDEEDEYEYEEEEGEEDLDEEAEAEEELEGEEDEEAAEDGSEDLEDEYEYEEEEGEEDLEDEDEYEEEDGEEDLEEEDEYEDEEGEEDLEEEDEYEDEEDEEDLEEEDEDEEAELEEEEVDAEDAEEAAELEEERVLQPVARASQPAQKKAASKGAAKEATAKEVVPKEAAKKEAAQKDTAQKARAKKAAPKKAAEPKAADDGTRPGSVPPARVDGPVDDGRVFEAGVLILERGRVAVSLLQREFSMDFDAATALLDELQAHGLIGPYIGGRTREILMSPEEWAAKAPVPG